MTAPDAALVLNIFLLMSMETVVHTMCQSLGQWMHNPQGIELVVCFVSRHVNEVCVPNEIVFLGSNQSVPTTGSV